MNASSDTVVEPAPAKLNLYLHVVGRRADGYHLLDSLVAFAACGDVLRARAAGALSLSLDGPFAGALAAEPDNLVLKAARALSGTAAGAGHRAGDAAAPGAEIALTKNLPVASGIGGGSADAAAALRALRRLWRSAVDDRGLADIAYRLGADVPVCLRGAPTFVGGIGEVTDPAPRLPPAGLVLVNPRIPLSTPRVFQARSGPFSVAQRFSEAPRDADALARALAARHNDLEPAAIAIVPAISTVLEALAASPGCRIARMSGSGATCFGIYDNAVIAAEAARWLRQRDSTSWWIEPTRLAPA